MLLDTQCIAFVQQGMVTKATQEERRSILFYIIKHIP